MKVITFILLLVSLTFAQLTVWGDKYYDSDGVDHAVTLSENTAIFSSGTYFSAPYSLSYYPYTFTGLWGFDLAISQPTGDLNIDSLRVYPQYWGGKSIGWITADLAILTERQWESDSYVSTDSVLNETDDTGKIWYWTSKPGDEYSLYAFPFNRVRLKIVITGSGTLGIRQEIFYVSYTR